MGILGGTLMETIFQIGDKVEHVITGCEGYIEKSEAHAFKLFCELNKYIYFDHRGIEDRCKYPSIRLIERPKKKVKKEAKVYLFPQEIKLMKTLKSYTDDGVNKIPVTLIWEEEDEQL